MVYPLPALTRGNIIRRYKRFLADVELGDGRVITAHCPNTGAMTTCWRPGAPVELSHSDNPKRKLPWTLERVDMGHGWVGVNTARVNHVIASGLRKGWIPQLDQYRDIRTEPAFNIDGFPKSRLDLLLSNGPHVDAYVEIKNATLLDGDIVRFPDAVTERGRKHLELLQQAVRRGYRGVIVFAVNRPEGHSFEPAWDIDPDYGHTLMEVTADGVEALAVRLQHLPTGIAVRDSQQYLP